MSFFGTLAAPTRGAVRALTSFGGVMHFSPAVFRAQARVWRGWGCSRLDRKKNRRIAQDGESSTEPRYEIRGNAQFHCDGLGLHQRNALRRLRGLAGAKCGR